MNQVHNHIFFFLTSRIDLAIGRFQESHTNRKVGIKPDPCLARVSPKRQDQARTAESVRRHAWIQPFNELTQPRIEKLFLLPNLHSSPVGSRRHPKAIATVPKSEGQVKKGTMPKSKPF
jgi:hypothetical protein